jgi:hypothetical protein
MTVKSVEETVRSQSNHVELPSQPILTSILKPYGATLMSHINGRSVNNKPSVTFTSMPPRILTSIDTGASASSNHNIPSVQITQSVHPNNQYAIQER